MYGRYGAVSFRVCSPARPDNEPRFFHGALDAPFSDAPASSCAPSATRRRGRARGRQTPGSMRTARPRSPEVPPVSACAAESTPKARGDCARNPRSLASPECPKGFAIALDRRNASTGKGALSDSRSENLDTHRCRFRRSLKDRVQAGPLRQRHLLPLSRLPESEVRDDD
jgi:hypothetical protein